MGVRALEPAYARVLVAPMPPTAPQAQYELVYPLPRGVVRVVVQAALPNAVTLVVSVPGNTRAQVCAPAYLFADGARVVLAVDGALAASTPRGGMLCVAADLTGATRRVTLSASS